MSVVQDGQQYIVGYPPRMEGWVSTHPHDRYAPMAQGETTVEACHVPF